MLLTVMGVARYLIVDNREVLVHPLASSDEADVRHFLLGAVLGAILHSRQMLVLHASTLATDDGAVLFSGRGGAGKSTALAALLQRGYRMLADDKAVVRLNDAGAPVALPGYPVVRLPTRTVKVLEYPAESSRLRTHLGTHVVAVEAFCTVPMPVRAIYSIRAHNRPDVCLERLTRMEAFEVLNRDTYRRRFMQERSQRQTHLRLVSAVANQAATAQLLRPHQPRGIRALRERIEEDWRG